MKVDDQVLVHIQELGQHLVSQFRRENLEIARCAEGTAHHKVFAVSEGEARRGDIVLRGQAAGNELIVVKGKRIALIGIEGLVHDLQTLHSVQGISGHAQHLEIVENICFDALQLWPRLSHAVRFHRKGDVLAAHQAVVALRQLILQHLRIFHANIIEIIALWRNADHALKLCHVGLVIDEGELEVDRAVKVVEKITPVLEDRVLVLILRKLVVNIVEAYRLGIELVVHPADAVAPHLPVGNGTLCGDTLLFCRFCILGSASIEACLAVGLRGYSLFPLLSCSFHTLG